MHLPESNTSNGPAPGLADRWPMLLLIVGLVALAALLQWLPRVGLPEVPQGKEKQIEIWSWSIAADALSGLTASFEEDHPEVHVYINKNGSNLQTRLLLALSAGSGVPDASQLQEREAPKYTRTGRLTDLTPWAGQYADDFAPAFWDSCVYEGQVYAIPWDVGPCAVFYKRWVFERYDLDPNTIETWDDFIAMGQELYRRSEERDPQNPVRMLPLSPSGLLDFFQIMMQQNGGGVFDEEGRIILDSPQNREALTIIRRVLSSGIAANLTPYSPALNASYQGDDVACYPAAVWSMQEIKNQAGDTAGGWGVFRLPAYRPGGLRTSNLGGSVLIIPLESEDPETTWRFLEHTNCTVEGQIHQFREQGLFPAYMPAYDDPFFAEPDPFFAGQAVNQLFAQDLERLPRLVRTSDWNEAERYLGRSINRWAEDEDMEHGDYLRGVAEALGRKLLREVRTYEELVAERGEASSE